MPPRPTEVLAAWLRRAGAALLLGLLAAGSIRAQSSQPVVTEPDSDIKIQVTDVYSCVPLRGFVPLRVTITNSSNSDGVWEIQTKASDYGNNQSYDAQAICAVPARQTHVFEVLSPLPTFSNNMRMDPTRVNVQVAGPGVDSGLGSNVQFTENLIAVSPASVNIPVPVVAGTPGSGIPPAPAPLPPGVFLRGGRGIIRSGARAGARVVYRQQGPALFVGLSPALNQDKGAQIITYFNSLCARPLQQTSLDPDLLSSDWRAYLSFDLLFYTAADWLDATPGARLAITQWVAAGGELRLVANSDGGLDLPPRDGEHYGAGFIELFTPDELANYNFSAEHSDPAARFLFSLAYQPATPAAPAAPSPDLPAGLEKRVFTVSQNTLLQLLKFDPASLVSANQSVNYAVEDQLVGSFQATNAKLFTGPGRLNFEFSFDPNLPSKIAATDTQENLDLIATVLKNNGEPDGVVAATGPALPPATTTAAVNTPPAFADAAPHLVAHYLLVAIVILCFGVLVGPVNLFVFCNGPRRPNLLWVTPLLAGLSGLVILGFILLAEGVGGHGLTFRVTQLVPDGKFAIESEVESSVSGVLFQHDFELANPAWILELHTENPREGGDSGNFWQSGPRYSGEWFASRRQQTLVAQTVAPSRAALHVVPAAGGQPPVLTSEYNDWMEKLFYLDDQGRYWKVDRISDGQPTPLQPTTAEEFNAAWDAIVASAPPTLTENSGALHKLTPRPGTFFALGNGGNPVLEPALSGLHWSNFRHVITGPVIP